MFDFVSDDTLRRTLFADYMECLNKPSTKGLFSDSPSHSSCNEPLCMLDRAILFKYSAEYVKQQNSADNRVSLMSLIFSSLIPTFKQRHIMQGLCILLGVIPPVVLGHMLALARELATPPTREPQHVQQGGWTEVTERILQRFLLPFYLLLSLLASLSGTN